MAHLSRSAILFLVVSCGLILFTPTARVYNVNIVFWGMLFLGMLVATGPNVFPVFRNGSPALLFLAESIRKAKVRTGTLTDSSESAKLGGMEVIAYDGFNYPPALSVDKSIAVVGSGSTEVLPDADVTLVYSRTAVLRDARTSQGLFSAYFSDLASVHSTVAFEAKRKTASEFRFGPFLNELISRPTSEDLWEQESIIKTQGAGIADALERVAMGQQSSIDMLKRIQNVTAQKSVIQKAKQYFIGDKQTASKDDKAQVQTGSDVQ